MQKDECPEKAPDHISPFSSLCRTGINGNAICSFTSGLSPSASSTTQALTAALFLSPYCRQTLYLFIIWLARLHLLSSLCFTAKSISACSLLYLRDNTQRAALKEPSIKSGLPRDKSKGISQALRNPRHPTRGRRQYQITVNQIRSGFFGDLPLRAMGHLSCNFSRFFQQCILEPHCIFQLISLVISAVIPATGVIVSGKIILPILSCSTLLKPG